MSGTSPYTPIALPIHPTDSPTPMSVQGVSCLETHMPTRQAPMTFDGAWKYYISPTQRTQRLDNIAIECLRFLGITNYFNRFIHRHSTTSE